MMLVIDASVVIKWFIEEKDSAKALLLKDNHINSKTILIAPDLLIYEVANVLLFSKIFTPLEIKGCLQDLYELEIDLINPSIDFVLSAIELAFSASMTHPTLLLPKNWIPSLLPPIKNFIHLPTNLTI